MADTFKYQLIQSSSLTIVEDRIDRTLYKIILACAGLILTVCYYNLPIPEAELAIIEFDVSTVSPTEIFKINDNASHTTIGKTHVP